VEVVKSWLASQLEDCWGLSRCEVLLWEAGSWGREQFGNPEEGERQTLEAVTRRLVKTQQTEKILSVCSTEL
jgi:hypothetical protein